MTKLRDLMNRTPIRSLSVNASVSYFGLFLSPILAKTTPPAATHSKLK